MALSGGRSFSTEASDDTGNGLDFHGFRGRNGRTARSLAISGDRHVTGSHVSAPRPSLNLSSEIIEKTGRPEAIQMWFQPLVAKGLPEHHQMVDRRLEIGRAHV